MAHATTLNPNAVRNSRAIVGQAVKSRTPDSPKLPNAADFSSEEEYCEALLNAIFGPEDN
jgi:hypothetical protein